MRITADTNVLMRAITGDDRWQSSLAQAQLADADMIAVTIPTLCELSWVLSKGYKIAPTAVAEAIRRLATSVNVVVNRPAVDAGLALLDQGGDFADGAIAFEGRWMGGETFVSFDKKAVTLLERQGQAARLLA